jgi:hypothetical protein
MNGTYGIVYSGSIGVGLGIFTVEDSELVGSDLAGGKYRGRVTEDAATGEITAVFKMFVPRGLTQVQGTSSLDMDSTRGPITLTMPPRFGDGEPVKLQIPPGPVTVMVKRIPDEWAPYAAGMSVTVTPIP